MLTAKRTATLDMRIGSCRATAIYIFRFVTHTLTEMQAGIYSNLVLMLMVRYGFYSKNNFHLDHINIMCFLIHLIIYLSIIYIHFDVILFISQSISSVAWSFNFLTLTFPSLQSFICQMFIFHSLSHALTFSILNHDDLISIFSNELWLW